MDLERKAPADASLMKKINNKKSFPSVKTLAVFAAVVLLGVGTGYGGASVFGRDSSPLSVSDEEAEVEKGAVIGSDDLETFKDTTEGVLKEGGINGEGQYHLERPGGESQNVYLTSSIVDLSSFKDKKIKVWGETQKAQYAGWLMDVGRVEVLE